MKLPGTRLVVLAFAAIAFASCSSKDAEKQPVTEGLTTRTKSEDLRTASERLEFVAKYIGPVGDATDTRFDISYNDNSTGRIPGPSDWRIEVALFVKPGTADKWSEGFVPKPELDISWASRFLEGVDITDSPRFFYYSGVERTIYPADGIVLIRSLTN